jgi:hypothetical protein
MSDKNYVIYRGSEDEKNIIGHLHLDTIRQIHGPDIYINHRKGFVIVKNNADYMTRRRDAQRWKGEI